MSSENINKHVVVLTDYALGDDHGAVLALCAYASLHKDMRFSFVGTYGNRSTSKATANLASQLPRLWKQLGQTDETCPDVYEGADRPSQKPEAAYTEGTVERMIHADFPEDLNITPRETKKSDELYHILKKSQIPVALLSLGAPTEAVKATEILNSQIRESVAMLGAGAIQGNTGPHREANATHDPEANINLLRLSEEHAIPLTLVRLDCTEQDFVLIDNKTIKVLEKELGVHSFAMQEVNSIASEKSTYGGFYLGKPYRLEAFPFGEKVYDKVPLHDLTAAMTLIDLLDEEDKKMFMYAKHIPISFTKDGSDGTGRDYYPDKPYTVTLAGSIERNFKNRVLSKVGAPLTEKYWKEIIKLLELYQ